MVQRKDSYNKNAKPAAWTLAASRGCYILGRSLVCVLVIALSLSQAARIVYQVLIPPSILSSRPWREQPLLSSRGVAMEIPTVNRHAVKQRTPDGSVTLLVPSAETILPEQPASLKFVLDTLQLSSHCLKDPEWLVVEVGGLHGDFGLTVASSTGCRTIVYEAQEKYATMMAQSLLLSENHYDANGSDSTAQASLSHTVKIRNAAVSTKPWVTFASPSTSTVSATPKATRISTEQLDMEFAKDTILLLKVDVEGGEDDALATASNLFAHQRIHHVILEYTPFHFAGRGTDYSTLLTRFFSATDATACYVLHHTLPKVYRIMLQDVHVFYETLHQAKIQTNLYCCLISTDVFLTTSEVWNVDTPLDD